MQMIKKYLALCLSVICAVSVFASCGSTEKKSDSSKSDDTSVVATDSSKQESDVENVNVDVDVDTATDGFDISLFKATCLDDMQEGKNVVMSTDSVRSALGMAATGAAGETKKQMESVMFGDGSIEDFNSNIAAVNAKRNKETDVKFNVANSVWVNSAVADNINADYLKTIGDTYSATGETLPFNSEAVQKINAWVKENTNDMIPAIIGEIPEGAMMYLVNAIAFEGEWREEYEESDIEEGKKFTNSKGTEEDCTMLYSVEGEYLQADDAVGFVKYYKGGKYAFVGILPDNSVTDFVSTLTADKWKDMMNSVKYVDVHTRIPEFKSDFNSSLSKSLQEMGMSAPFSDSADFSGMVSADSDTQFKISDVYHRAFIKVDRNGTKAAAATAVEMEMAAALDEPVEYYEVTLDRPFVYAIIDVDTKEPIFMGALSTTSE